MRKLLVGVLAISMLGNAALLYRVFDLGVTTTYGADEVDRRARQAEDARRLILQLTLGAPRTQMETIARRAGLEIVDKGDEGLVLGRGLQIIFSEGAVKDIKIE